MNGKIRYLREAVEENKDKITVPNGQLNLLLLDIEAVGSKWRHPERIGQAQLYEAADAVLNTLKNYLPYSGPFQKKVSPKEAPDYHKVIEHPMDIGQISRKMKNHEYNSKKEFADDLYLIYSNCLQYNTNPDNMYREYANAMKEKTDELLKGIPDIIIRTREEYLASFGREKENISKPVQSEIRSVNKDSSSRVDGFPILGVDENSLSQEDLSVKSNNSEVDQNRKDSIMAGPYSAHLEISSDDEEEVEADLELREMLAELHIPKLPSLWDPELNNPDRDKFFESGYDSSANNPTLDQYPQLQFSNRGTSAMIEHNIQTLKQSRILHAKLVAAKQNIPLSHLGITEQAPAEEVIDSKPKVDAKNLPPLVLNREGAFASMQRVVAKLCQHAGFEATSNTALTVLTEVAQDYFLNLGKTLRSYMDDYGNKMTTEEIISHTLYENGVRSVKDLESYVKNDIIRYGAKLKDIHGRLEIAYKDALVNPDSAEVDEESFPEGDEAFMIGNFGEDIGDDFFRFRDLGLGSLVVPHKLFFGTNKPKPQLKKTSEQGQQQSRYAPPPSWSPVVDPDSQIGVLREFFRNKMEESSGQLVEDEFLPAKQRNQQRPRVPPTGKIPPQPKRQLKPQLTAAALAEKKKKKERDAQIAEEKERAKLQKAEERAKKQAEKEALKRIKALEKEAQKKADAEAKEARKLEAELQRKLAQEAKEAKRAEAAKKATVENKKKKTTVKTGKAKTPQPEVTATPVPKKHELDDVSDSEMVPLAQRKKRRVEATSSRVGSKRVPQN